MPLVELYVSNSNPNTVQLLHETRYQLDCRQLFCIFALIYFILPQPGSTLCPERQPSSRS